MVTQNKTDAVECEFNVLSWVEWSEQDDRYSDVGRMGAAIAHTSLNELTHPSHCKHSASSIVLGMILRLYKQ